MPFDEVEKRHDAALAADFTSAGAHTHPAANAFGDMVHGHSKMKICVSGAARTGHCGLDTYEAAKALGREIVRSGAIITTGATTGFPLYAAVGAKEEGGLSIGFSPATGERDHIENWRLPLDYMDVIVYTGFGFPGRDLLLVRSSDAVILGCGRVGTIHEFSIAFEDKKPIGILEGDWETDEVVRHMLEASNRVHDTIVFDSDPKALLERITEMVKKDKEEIRLLHDRMRQSASPDNERDVWGG